MTPLQRCGVSADSTSSGPAPAIQQEEVIRDLRARDERDRNRADSPLKPATDAVLLDSTHMTLEETVKAAESVVAAKLKQATQQGNAIGS